MTPQCSIIIPVYGCWHLTRDCLESLRQHLPSHGVEIIVVDNGSLDETPQALPALGERLFGPAFKGVRSATNLGFARGCNLGAKQATGEYLFFLNNDTLALPGFWEPLHEELRQEGGIVGSRLLYPGGERVQHVGVSFTPGPKVCHIFEFFPATHPAVCCKRHVQAVTGAALALPRELFWQLGGFDEGFTNGLEDVDLCLKAGQMGASVRCQPQSTLIHLTSQTPGRFAAETANAQYFFQRWGGAIRPDFHRFAAGEGYTMGLSATLQPVMALPPHKLQTLEEQFGASHDPTLWLEAIHTEPLWRPGYDNLAQWLENRQAWADALPLRTLAARFFPCTATALALAKTATRAHDQALAHYAGQMLQYQRQAQGQRNELVSWARHLSQTLRHLGEEDLARLYDAWMRKPPTEFLVLPNAAGPAS